MSPTMSAGEERGRSARRDPPWLFRTYAGHSSARDSNRLYRANLARGQTGLSVAFDLPTQTGYDSDHPLAAGEVGRVGVPVGALPDMLTLFEDIPLERMNTSMTINATAPWLLALYIVAAERQGADRAKLAGTVQNDLIKEYLSRGTYIFPPRPSLKLTADVIAFTYREMPALEPGQRLLLPPAGGGCDAGAGARLRARRRDADPRHGQGRRPGAGRGPAAGGRPHQLLRQRRPALRHRDVQDARLHAPVGRDHARALRRRRPEAAPLPLRRPGQLARPDRAAAREQRLPHPARDARGRALEVGARARGAAAGLERGARPAAALGPAVEPAPAADPGLRDRSARVRRPVRRLGRGRGQGRSADAPRRAPSSRGSRRWAARSPRSRAATSSSAWSKPTARASRRSHPARRRWSASTASPTAPPRRSPPAPTAASSRSTAAPRPIRSSA